LCKLTGLESN